VTVGRTVPLMFAAVAGVFSAYGYLWIVVPLMIGAVYLQGELFK
jgi:hypothetical protein